MRKEMKRGLAAVFAASLLVSTVALSAGNAQVDAALTDDGLSDTTTTVPVVGADDTTETTTVSDVLGEETTTTTASGEETTGTETTTTTTQVITVQAKLHASFNGDNTDALSTDVIISSDNLADSYNISCMLTDPSASLDYVYLDFSLSDNPTQAIRDLCSGFTVTVTGVSTGADLTTTIPYTMAAEAVNYSATDASGNPVVRVTLYDSTVNGATATTTTTADATSTTDANAAVTTTAIADSTVDPLATTTTAAATGTGYLAQDAPIVDNLQLTFQITGLEYSPATTDTTTTVTKEAQQTTTIIRSNSGGSSGNSGGSYSSGGSSNSATPSSSSGSTSTTTPTQTADLSVGAIVVGALAAISLAGAAFTVTRRRKK